MKHVETEENDENFDCCTIYDSTILNIVVKNYVFSPSFEFRILSVQI